MKKDDISINEYMDANEKLIKYQICGITDDFWVGYYQGKLDMIDLTKRFLELENKGAPTMSKEWFGIVRWNPDDVIAAATNNGVEMTQEQATEWWKKNEEAFKNRMTELGNEVLSYMDF